MDDYIRDIREFGGREHDLFVGLDVDKASIAVTVMGKDILARSVKMAYDSENLLAFVNNHYAGSRVVFAYEAGPTGFGLYDSLVGAGHDCLVVSPGSIPDAVNNRVKTNRLDSAKLARLLMGNQLKGVRVPPEPIRELRSLVGMRYTYMQEIKAYKCRIKAEMLNYGIAYPPAPRGCDWSKKVVAQLRDLDCSVVVSFKINNMLDHLEHLRKQVKVADAAIRGHIGGNAELRGSIEYLMSVPGIGWRIACYTLSRMGDYRCLRSSKEAGAFLGLVPTEDSTGETINRGRITKCGDPRLRSMVIQGAWAAIRKDRELKALFERICASHSKKTAARVAIVAVARKLAERMHCVLKQQRAYELRAA